MLELNRKGKLTLLQEVKLLELDQKQPQVIQLNFSLKYRLMKEVHLKVVAVGNVTLILRVRNRKDRGILRKSRQLKTKVFRRLMLARLRRVLCHPHSLNLILKTPLKLVLPMQIELAMTYQIHWETLIKCKHLNSPKTSRIKMMAKTIVEIIICQQQEAVKQMQLLATKFPNPNRICQPVVSQEPLTSTRT